MGEPWGWPGLQSSSIFLIDPTLFNGSNDPYNVLCQKSFLLWEEAWYAASF